MRTKILLIAYSVIIMVSCKKDDNNPDQAQEEGKKIETAVMGHKYKITSITDQNGADATGIVPHYILDDRYRIKDRGTVEIIQGDEKSPEFVQDTINASWGIGYAANSVASIFFPLDLTSNTIYKTAEYKKPLFSVNLTNGEIQLMKKVGNNTYTIRYEQTL